MKSVFELPGVTKAACSGGNSTGDSGEGNSGASGFESSTLEGAKDILKEKNVKMDNIDEDGFAAFHTINKNNFKSNPMTTDDLVNSLSDEDKNKLQDTIKSGNPADIAKTITELTNNNLDKIPDEEQKQLAIKARNFIEKHPKIVKTLAKTGLAVGNIASKVYGQDAGTLAKTFCEANGIKTNFDFEQLNNKKVQNDIVNSVIDTISKKEGEEEQKPEEEGEGENEAEVGKRKVGA